MDDSTSPRLPASHIDGCPDVCGNTEAPYRWETNTGEVVCYYACGDCGAFWHTSWKVD